MNENLMVQLFDVLEPLLLMLLTAAVTAAVGFIAPIGVKYLGQKNTDRLVDLLRKALTSGIDAALAEMDPKEPLTNQKVEVLASKAVAHAERSIPDTLRKMAPKGQSSPPKDVLINIAKSVAMQLIRKRIGL